jgi:hypothetical protein
MKKIYKVGKIIGHGGYGCVFDLGKRDNKQFVGKMHFYNDEPMYTEYGYNQKEFMSIQKKILSFDPDEKYFITTTDIIRIDAKDVSECIQTGKEIFKKRGSVFKPEKFYDVFVQKKVKSVTNPLKWNLAQVQHAIEGLRLLHANGLVHNDIAKQNFGISNGMPVYIDCDGVSILQKPRVRFNNKKYFLDLNQTAEKDWNALKDIFW